MPRLPVFQMSQSVGVQNCCCSSTILPTEPLLQSGQFVWLWYLQPLSLQLGSRCSNEFWRGRISRPESSSVQGFVPFVAAYFSHSINSALGDYYTDGEIHIPVSLVNLLKKGSSCLSQNASIPTILVESFFQKDKPIPNRVYFQPWKSCWQRCTSRPSLGLDDFQDNTLRTPRIFSASLESCKAHDMGKPQSLLRSAEGKI